MTNLQIVLLKLFDPVMDASYSKIDKIDSEYYKHSMRVPIGEDTKIKATKEEADEYYARHSDGVYFALYLLTPAATPSNFISDLFFLLNSYQHLGLVKTIGNRSSAEKNLSEIEKELQRTEASRADWTGVGFCFM